MLDAGQPEAFLNSAVAAVGNGGDYQTALDRLPVPIYTTDAEGCVTFWNRACIKFAGRTPKLGEDRWCVTWRIYTTAGEFLPHEECPMAQAIKEQREIRGEVAIAMRPNGSRVAFRPYPTPLFDKSGQLTGAINMLIDISEEQLEALTEQAERCRRLANSTHDWGARNILQSMADGYEESAEALRH